MMIVAHVVEPSCDWRQRGYVAAVNPLPFIVILPVLENDGISPDPAPVWLMRAMFEVDLPKCDEVDRFFY